MALFDEDSHKFIRAALVVLYLPHLHMLHHLPHPQPHQRSQRLQLDVFVVGVDLGVAAEVNVGPLRLRRPALAEDDALLLVRQPASVVHVADLEGLRYGARVDFDGRLGQP